MLDGLNKHLRIGVSRTGIALLQTSGWMRSRATLLAECGMTAEQAASADWLAARLSGMIAEAKCVSQTVTVIVADDLVRMFMVNPPQNATRLQDCRAAAEMRFHTLYGDAVGGWQLEADWDAKRPFLACAIPCMLPAALRAAASERRLALVEIAPRFIAAWNRWHASLRPDKWFGAVHDGMLTLGVMDGRHLCAVRSTPIPAGSWDNGAWLPEHLAREALRLNLAAPKGMQLCGDIPGQWATQAFGTVTCERLDAAERKGNGVLPSALETLARTGVHQ